MRRFSTVYEKHVEQSVVVRIEERDTSAHGFDEKSIGRLTTELLPGNSGLFRDVRKISLEAEAVAGMDAVFQTAMTNIRKTISVIVPSLGIKVRSRLRLITQ